MGVTGAARTFSFDVVWEGDRATLKCRGQLVAGVTDGLYEGLKPLLGEAKRVLVDLEDVTYVDSMGLGVLVRLYVAARGAGCELKLRHVGKQVRNVLKLTNLSAVLGEAEDSGTAVH